MKSLQRGFTLIELLIAMLIALFLLGGLVSLVGAMKITSGIQDNLSQMQDNERLAMTLITDVVQSAGYFPNPHTSLSVAMPAVTIGTPVPDVFNAQQSINGTGAGNAVSPGDTLTVRYQTSGLDGVINCLGATSLVPVTFVNQFKINPVSGNLQCALTVINNVGTVVSTTTVDIVPNVQNFQVLYGMKTNTASATLSVDSYLDAPAVSALVQAFNSGWTQVMTVRIAVTFNNLLANQAGQAATPTILFLRVIDVMNLTGVKS
jgi:type IV pilus assembly protein PilW